MSLPLRILPIVEHWDCQGCGKCCRGSVIPLDEADRQRLSEQKWEDRPEFKDVAVVVRRGWLRPEYELARQDDGSCVFLTGEGRCRVHELHGEAAKPLVCRLYPLQIVPLEKKAVLTVRRSCPSAAADEGRPLAEHLAYARRLAAEKGLGKRASPIPSITRRLTRDWPDAERVLAGIETLLTDERWPMVRRLVHGLIFCQLLDRAKCADYDSSRFGDLVDVLVEASPEEVGDLFRQRRAPSRAASVLFRQTAAEYVRLHPQFSTRESWRQRWVLTKAAFSIVRGKGTFPLSLPGQKPVAFDRLEEPLGALPEEVGRAIVQYFEATAASRQFAVLGRRGWSLTERFRGLALAYAVAQWLLRLRGAGESPTREDVVDVIATIERGQGYGPLEGARHRSRVQTLASLEELPVLLAWYAR
jgi:lysine-N-methylase